MACVAPMAVLGLDPAFANFGICTAVIDAEEKTIISVDSVRLVTTEKAKTKSIRRSSDDFYRAKVLVASVNKVIKERGPDFVFAEIPSGSQSARASWALGITLGVIAGIDLPIIQVTPAMAKMAALGNKTATKMEMIQWAVEKYPDLEWIRTKRKGVLHLSPKNEHMADSIAVVEAGLQTVEFDDYSRWNQGKMGNSP